VKNAYDDKEDIHAIEKIMVNAAYIPHHDPISEDEDPFENADQRLSILKSSLDKESVVVFPSKGVGAWHQLPQFTIM